MLSNKTEPLNRDQIATAITEKVEETEPYVAAVTRLLEIGESESALRILKLPQSARLSKWGHRYEYLHRWLNNAFDWDEEQGEGECIWLALHDKVSEKRIKLYQDGE